MQTDRPLLTIAIPTYNRADYLRELLSSLIDQFIDQPRVELLISDNASPDNTAHVVQEFILRGLEIRNIRNEVNIGPDANFIQCYEEAAGKYVWIIGDDDLILPGGIKKIVGLLESESPDYAFVAPYVFFKSIDEIRPRSRHVPTKSFGDATKLITLVNLHADLILISSAIVNKDRIEANPHPPFVSLTDTNLVQLGWVFTSLRYLRSGLFVELGVLAARADNSRGGFQAARVFGESYKRAVTVMLGTTSKLSKKLIGDHLRIWFPRNWPGFRVDGEDGRKQKRLLRTTFQDYLWYWICAFPVVSAPMFIARFWAKALWFVMRVRMKTLTVPNKAPDRIRSESSKG